MKFVKWLLSIILAVGAIFLIDNYQRLSEFMLVAKISLQTQDHKNLTANYFKSAAEPSGWLLLVHMMPATKESWQGLAENLQRFGYESLALDLRGHGESDGGPNGYQNFSDAEHQASIQDLESAWKFLKERGAKGEKTAVIGASIGANLAIQFLTRHPEVKRGVFLSPGNYRGLNSAELVKILQPDQQIIFAASRQDDRAAGNNAVQDENYFKLASQVRRRHLILFDGAGHGTDLLKLKSELDLETAIKKFLEDGSIN